MRAYYQDAAFVEAIQSREHPSHDGEARSLLPRLLVNPTITLG